MVTEEIGAALAQVFTNVIIYIALFTGILGVISISLIITGVVINKKGKLEKNKGKLRYKIIPAICWVMAGGIIFYILCMFLH